MRFILLADDKSQPYELYQDDKIIIRDIKEFSKKELYRQLILKHNPNEVESEIRMYNISQQDAKGQGHVQIKTNKHFKASKQKSCFDPTNIANHLMKSYLSCMYFAGFSDKPEEKKLEVLVLGAGIGLIPYYFKFVYDPCINITAVEKNEKMKQYGIDFFGIDYDKAVNKLFNESVEQFISKNSSQPKKYDYILLAETNFLSGCDLSPNEEYLTKSNITKIRVTTLIFRAC